MALTSLSIGPVYTVEGNQIYALPRKSLLMLSTSSAGFEVSNDRQTWQSITLEDSQAVFQATFIRADSSAQVSFTEIQQIGITPHELEKHAVTHIQGGSDQLNVRLLGGYPGIPAGTEETFLRADGTFAPVEGSGGSIGALASYQFNAAATVPPPLSGRIKFNSAAYTTVTRVYIHYINRTGDDLYWGWKLNVNAGTVIHIQEQNNRNKYVRFVLNEDPIDQSTYTELVVTFVDAAGSFFLTNDTLMVRAQLQ